MKNKISGAAIVCDIIGSRKKQQTNEYHNALVKITSMLNEKYGNRLTDFTVRNGDELFGVLPSFSDGYRAFKDIYFLSRQEKAPLYAAIGFGSIYTDHVYDPHLVQGSAIWSAAEAVAFMKDERRTDLRPFVGLDKQFKFFANAASQQFPFMNINYQLYFLLEKMMKRTEKQQEAIRLVESHPGMPFDEIGIKLNYESNQGMNVSKILFRAEFHLVQGAEQSLMHLLDTCQSFMETHSTGDDSW